MADFTLHLGDCLDVLRGMPAASVDAVLTDPPSGIAFMDLHWDTDKGGRDQWIAWLAGIMAECRRVIKPGGHALVWALPRTSHWTAMALEDAGWCVKDVLTHHFGTGFPKSLNVSASLHDVSCHCRKTDVQYSYERSTDLLPDLRSASSQEAAQPSAPVLRPHLCGEGEAHTAGQEGVRRVRDDMATADALSSGAESYLLSSLRGGTCPSDCTESQEDAPHGDMCALWQGVPCPPRQEAGGVLQPILQRQGAGEGGGPACPQRAARLDGGIDGKLLVQDDRPQESCVEGRGDVLQDARAVYGSTLHPSTALGAADGAQGRLRDGAPSRDGADGGSFAGADGGGTPPRSQPRQQRPRKPRTVADERGAQSGGAWPTCARCGKPSIPEGLGTALKPSSEHWILARAPLAEKTIAANVLAHGTGALNIDAARIGTDFVGWGGAPAGGITWHAENCGLANGGDPRPVVGRWPANVVFTCPCPTDEHLEGCPVGELDRQSGVTRSGGYPPEGGVRSHVATYGTPNARGAQRFGGSEGGASRFFYVAKPSPSERALPDGTRNPHPTLKPVALLAHLAALICPPGGVLLDPFMGSGSAGVAALRCGFSYIGIEREPEYHRVARLRLAATQPPLREEIG